MLVLGLFRLGLGFIYLWFKVKFGFRQGLLAGWFRVSCRVCFRVYVLLVWGLVQGCFKVYWGLFRVGFRVGLRFLQGFLMVCFAIYLGLT